MFWRNMLSPSSEMNFNHEDGDSMFLQNGICLQVHTHSVRTQNNIGKRMFCFSSQPKGQNKFDIILYLPNGRFCVHMVMNREFFDELNNTAAPGTPFSHKMLVYY
jgi:hypothetical protein